jgi:hypothetical protein
VILNTMKKSTNKKPNRRRARKGARFAVSQMQGAPAGVSQDLQQFTRFLPGSNPEGIKMHTCVPLVQVERASTLSGGGGLFPGSGSTEAMAVQLNLTNPRWRGASSEFAADYVSPVFDLIASAFVRFRISKLVFHYEPQASATTDERLVFAFAADPAHPVLWSSTVTQSGLLSVADSVAFAPWRAWSMDVTCKLDDQLFYTFYPTGAASLTERFSDFGVMALLTSSASQSSALLCGVLYAEIVVELDEFCPISVTRPSAFLHLIPRMGERLERHSELTRSGSGKASSEEDTPKKTFASYEKYLLDKQV